MAGTRTKGPPAKTLLPEAGLAGEPRSGHVSGWRPVIKGGCLLFSRWSWVGRGAQRSSGEDEIVEERG